jgi:S1-C subfamily serine protease
MDIKALFIVALLLLGGGAAYEYQQLAETQKNLSDDDAKVTSLQADNQALIADKSDLTSKLADANTRIQALILAKEKAEKDAAAAIAAAKQALPATAPSASASVPSGATAAAPTPPSAPAKLTADQMSQAIVVIRGDNAEGTGFLVKTPDGPVIVTNLHVLSNNPHIQISTSSGVQIVPMGLKGALDRDLAMITIQDGPYTYLPVATDMNNTVHTGDEVITPGDSQGGNVVLSTKGKLLALGPDRIEFDNPIYHGNSGGPVFHTDSGTVLGVVTEAVKVDVSNDLDKTSFQSRNSAIASSMRYFGLRLDTVPKWESYDPRRFENETAFLEQFDKQSRSLDSYLNYDPKANGQTPNAEAQPYLADDQIMAAHNSFRQRLSGADTGDQIEALRKLGFDLDAIAGKDMDKIQNLNNFYSFDQMRARDEIAYRKALIDEIQAFSTDVSRIGSLPQTNN